jgi:hypothetical protein
LPDDRLKRGHRVLDAVMELKVNRRRSSLFLFLSRVLKIVVFSHREWQRFELESHAHQELLIVDPWSHESTGMDQSTPPFLARICRWSVIRYLE